MSVLDHENIFTPKNKTQKFYSTKIPRSTVYSFRQNHMYLYINALDNTYITELSSTQGWFAITKDMLIYYNFSYEYDFGMLRALGTLSN